MLSCQEHPGTLALWQPEEGVTRCIADAIARLSRTRLGPGTALLARRVEAYRPNRPEGGSVRIGALPLGAVTIAIVRSDGHAITAVEPALWTALLPLQGRLRVEAEGVALDAGAGSALDLGPCRRTATIRPVAAGSPFLGIGLTAPLLAVPPFTGAPHLALRRLDTEASPAMQALRGYLHYLVGEWARPGSVLLRPGMRLASEALILDLVEAIQEEAWPVADPGAATVAETLVQRAEALLRDRSDAPLRLGGIARELGVGLRTLQQGFLSRRGASPRAVLNTLRLDRVRARLLRPEAGMTVTTAALASGFTHLGRFAETYRARFGEPPSETLRRARR